MKYRVVIRKFTGRQMEDTVAQTEPLKMDEVIAFVSSAYVTGCLQVGDTRFPIEDMGLLPKMKLWWESFPDLMFLTYSARENTTVPYTVYLEACDYVG